MAEHQPVPVKKEAGVPTDPMMRRPFLSLRDEIDRVFDEFMSWSPFRASAWERPLARLGMRGGDLSADVIEKGDRYEIDVDVPGMSKDNIEIALANGGLRVRCQAVEEKEESGKEYYSRERYHETCSRDFEIPAGVDVDKIAADLENGVLKIVLPKTAEAQKQPRKIEIRPH